MTLDDLIARLESVTEGSRELDAEIAVAIFEKRATDDDLIYAVKTRAFDHCAPGTYWHASRSGRSLHTAPNYTESIDAAVTMLPDWMSFELTRSAAGERSLKRARLWDWRRSPLMSDPGNEWKAEANSTLPLVTCIAALKARRVMAETTKEPAEC